MTAEVYPGLPQTAKMQCFVTTVNDQKSVTIVSKGSIVDVWGKSGCTSVYFELTQYIIDLRQLPVSKNRTNLCITFSKYYMHC